MFYENDILLRQNSGMGVRNNVIMKKKNDFVHIDLIKILLENQL